jgi:hypothetical protein
VSAVFYTARGEYVYMGDPDPPDWAGVPAAELEADDVHVVEVETGISADNTYRQVFGFLHEAADLSLVLPPPGDDATVTVIDTAPYVRLRYQPASAAGHQLHELRFTQVDGPPSRWRDAASKSWLDAGYSIETPDLSALAGWNPDWALTAGSTVRLTGLTYAGSSTVAHLLDGLSLIDAPPGYWGAQVTGLDGLSFSKTEWRSEVIP